MTEVNKRETSFAPSRMHPERVFTCFCTCFSFEINKEL